MADQTKPADPFAGFLDMQGETMREMWDQFMPAGAPVMKDWGEISAWGETAQKLQAMWLEFLGEKSRDAACVAMALDPPQFMLLSQGWARYDQWHQSGRNIATTAELLDPEPAPR